MSFLSAYIASKEEKLHPIKLLSLIGAPIIFTLMLMSEPPEGLSVLGWKVLAITTLMVIWWITEALPFAITALIPLAALPLLDVYAIKYAAGPYASPVIFLFIGAYLIAIAVEKWNLHKRISLNMIRAFGLGSGRIIAAFMFTTAFISLWVSNMTAVVMLLPIAMSVINILMNQSTDSVSYTNACRNFGTALMLGIAASATIGGVGTLVGTPTNMVMKGYLEQSFGIKIGFVDWMYVGIPFVLIMLPITWLLLVKVFFRCSEVKTLEIAKTIREEARNLGKISREELIVASVFIISAAGWIFADYLEGLFGILLEPAEVAILAAIIMFLIPVNLKSDKFLLSMEDIEKIPFSVVLLFGGGLSLAGAISETGVATWIGLKIEEIATVNIMLIMAIIVVTIIIITEVLSNLATAAAFLPVIGAIAIGAGVNPLLFAIPATIAASCGFMMPFGTPSSTAVFASGYVKISHMVKIGLWLNVASAVAIIIVSYYIAPAVFGFSIK